MVMNIEDIKKKAEAGDVQAQVDLAHAYLYGNGIRQNRKHYQTWLIKAGLQGNIEAQLELIDFYCQRHNKYASPSKALFWINKAQELGVTIDQEYLVATGDPDTCNQQIEEFLLGSPKSHNFVKAKELILRLNLSQEKLLEYANRYYDMYQDDARKVSNISYLYKISFNQNHEKLNEFAVGLTNSKAKNSMKIAFSLFAEAYRLGNSYAASSYLYCLLNGRGCKRDISMGASVYYDCKRKNIDISRAFASATNQGVVVELPNSLAWKMDCFKCSFTEVIEKVTNSYYGIFRAIWRILFFLWTLVKKIGFIPIALSSSILLCIQNLDFLWIVPARICLNSLIGTTWVGYAVSFIIFTAFFSIPVLLYKKWKSGQPNEQLRRRWNEYGLSLPSFIVVNTKTIERTDGCYGPSTLTTVYTIRFVEKVPNWIFQQNGEWINPTYVLESYKFKTKQLSEDMAEITVSWKYTP